MKPILFLVLATPFTAQADKILVDDKFFVDYEGFVTQVINEPSYTLGSPISGRLIVDLATAGDDCCPGDPNATAFGNANDFITGFLLPSEDFPPGDIIGWHNASRGVAEDFFNVVDGQGIDEFNLRRLTITASGYNLFNDGAPHGFEATDDDAVSFFGELSTRIKGELAGLMQFSIERLSVRPQKCFK